ncbi:MAG TPA: hypothetical protein VFH80_10285 [Solirubrobacteraceae bacterium]|nr:hypothetical protein [Solirubrobacteraceae bacterium]
MAASRALLDVDLRRLRTLAESGNPHAIRAARLWDERRRAPARSRERRHLARAFERAAARALEGK